MALTRKENDMNVIHVISDNFGQLEQLVQQALDEIPNVERRLVDIKYFYCPGWIDQGIDAFGKPRQYQIGECCASIIFRKVSES